MHVHVGERLHWLRFDGRLRLTGRRKRLHGARVVWWVALRRWICHWLSLLCNGVFSKRTLRERFGLVFELSSSVGLYPSTWFFPMSLACPALRNGRS